MAVNLANNSLANDRVGNKKLERLFSNWQCFSHLCVLSLICHFLINRWPFTLCLKLELSVCEYFDVSNQQIFVIYNNSRNSSANNSLLFFSQQKYKVRVVLFKTVFFRSKLFSFFFSPNFMNMEFTIKNVISKSDSIQKCFNQWNFEFKDVDQSRKEMFQR